jgi:hypothetical protein
MKFLILINIVIFILGCAASPKTNFDIYKSKQVQINVSTNSDSNYLIANLYIDNYDRGHVYIKKYTLIDTNKLSNILYNRWSNKIIEAERIK